MSDTVSVRVAGRAFSYEGENYEQGDELEVEERFTEFHPNTLEVIESGSAESEDVEEDVADDPDESGYSREELEEMDRSELQQLASNADTDEISGRSGNQAIIDYFADDSDEE